MELSEAREHLETVDRILAASSRRLYIGGEFFVAWGITGAILDVVLTLVAARLVPPSAQWIGLPVLIAAIVFTILRSRFYRKYGTMPFLQREYLTVLQVSIGAAFFANVFAFSIFSGVASMAIWNIVESIVLAYIAVHGNARAGVATVIMLLSIAIANFVPQYSGYILAAGVLLGYAGFGAAELVARD